jgi:hypothetical protein
MNGALPPNSSDSFLTVPAHCSISNLPTSVEPVKVSLRTTRLRGARSRHSIGGDCE